MDIKTGGPKDEHANILQRLERIEEKVDHILDSLEMLAQLFSQFELEEDEEEGEEEEEEAAEEKPRNGGGFRGGCCSGCR